MQHGCTLSVLKRAERTRTPERDQDDDTAELNSRCTPLAVEFVADKASRKFFDAKSGVHRIVAAKALEAGVLTRPLPFIEVNSFSPPLCMTRSEAEEAVARYGKGLDAATPDLVKAATGQ